MSDVEDDADMSDVEDDADMSDVEDDADADQMDKYFWHDYDDSMFDYYSDEDEAYEYYEFWGIPMRDNLLSVDGIVDLDPKLCDYHPDDMLENDCY